MATRLEACRELFRRDVLPRFPTASERFQRYFTGSYDLLLVLPTVDHNILRYNKERGEFEPTPVSCLPQDIALTALGIKPLALCDSTSEASVKMLIERFGIGLLSDAGLELLSLGPIGAYIYDPRLVAPVVSVLLNRRVYSEEVAGALREYLEGCQKADQFPHALLGYPEPLQYGAKSGLFVAGSRDFTKTPFYLSRLGFKLRTPELVLQNLNAWASAAAIIEEIRSRPTSVTSYAGVAGMPGWENRKVTVTIKRSAEILGDWTRCEENDFRQESKSAAA